MNQWPFKFPIIANVIFGKHDEVWWLYGKYFLAMWQILLALWQIWGISEQQAAPNVRPCVSGGVQIPAPHSHVCPAVLSSFVTPYTLHAFAHTEYFPRLYSVILVRIIRTLACSSLFGAKSAICRRVTSHARESQYVRCSDERHKSTSLDIDLEYSKYSWSAVLGITVGATCAQGGVTMPTILVDPAPAEAHVNLKCPQLHFHDIKTLSKTNMYKAILSS